MCFELNILLANCNSEFCHIIHDIGVVEFKFRIQVTLDVNFLFKSN